MSININLKLLILFGVFISFLCFANLVFAQDASSSASPTATPTASPTPTSTPTPTPAPTATPSPTTAPAAGAASASPSAKPKEDKVLGAATSLGATGKEIDFIKWGLLAAVFVISLFIGIRALKSNVKE